MERAEFVLHGGQDGLSGIGSLRPGRIVASLSQAHSQRDRHRRSTSSPAIAKSSLHFCCVFMVAQSLTV